MNFASLDFIFIGFPAFLLVYYIIPKNFRGVWALLGSLAFFVYGSLSEPIHIVFLIISVFINYCIAIIIEQNRYKKKLWLIIGIVYNFARLILYKYSGWIIEEFNGVFGTAIEQPGFSLPLGISFYTFCAVAYLVDVYRKNIRAERSVLKYGEYMLFFPKMMSGPITRYDEMRRPLSLHETSFEGFDDGLREFIVGLGMKVIIANQLGNVWNAAGTIGYISLSTPLAWFALLSYSMQLYFDFAGYSLMAIGIGRMLGFELPQNFDHPYWSCSMTEFWRRWHMTLGSWFKDYVYIPLGGNRKGMLYTILNLLIVWVFTGVWHGVGGNFIVWGLFLFVIIAIEKLGLKKNVLDRVKPVGHIYMLLLIPISWLPFAIGNLGKVVDYLSRLFPFFGEGINIFEGDFAKYAGQYWVFFLAGVIFCLPFARKLFDKYKKSVVVTVLLLAVFWFSIYLIYKGANDPFMYGAF